LIAVTVGLLALSARADDQLKADRVTGNVYAIVGPPGQRAAPTTIASGYAAAAGRFGHAGATPTCQRSTILRTTATCIGPTWAARSPNSNHR